MNQIGFLGLVGSKGYYKRPRAVVCEKGLVCRGNGQWEEVGYMGISRNRDNRLAFKSVLKDFIDNVLTIPTSSLFKNGTARTPKAHWRRRV